MTYRLNRTVFKAQSAKEASDHSIYYKKLDWKERLAVSAYLISVAFNYPSESAPKLDRTKFTVRSRNAQ